MTERRLVLAVDLGTGGPKVGYATTHGDVVWWRHRQVRTTYGEGGLSTQDPHEWWRLVVGTAREAVSSGAINPAEVVAIGTTGQWASTVPVDVAGAPVGDCVMWTDTRGATHARAVVGGPVQGYRLDRLATWVRRNGGVPSTSGADPIGHMLHLERDQPTVAAATRWYLEPVDHLAMRFTGVPAATQMSMTAAWLTDTRHLGRLRYDDRLVRLSGVEPTKLPPLVPSLAPIAPVQSSVAAEIGLPDTALVVTGMPDLHAAALGSGCVREHQTHVSIGTSGWISCPLTRKKTDVLRMNATVPGLDDRGYLLGNSQDSAGRCLQWFRDTVASGFGASSMSYDEVTALAGTAPPGSNGVIFTPWLTGERSPVDDRSARAGFHNISVSTTPADLARAVLEGVALNTRWLLEAAEHFTGRRLEPLRIIGGGAQSDLWCQITADVCDRTLERVAEPLLCGLRGVGLGAGLALGDITRDDVHGLVPVDATFSPDSRTRSTYESHFTAFPRLHRGQRHLFRTLNG